jgi:hypothetical protein
MAVSPFTGTCQGPLTSRAHRLRKPHRTSTTADALCRALSPRVRAPTRSSWDLPGCPERTSLRRRRENAAVETSPHQARQARRRVRANGHRTNQDAFRRIVPMLAHRAGRVAGVVHVRGPCPRTLSLAASPIPPRQRLVGHFEPSRRSETRRLPCASPRCEKDASHRLLQPTLDTSTPSAARFPTTLPSSRDLFRRRDLLDCANPPGTAEPSLRPSRPPTDESSGGASLDGEPPASAPPQPFGRSPEPKLRALARFDHRAFQVGPRSKALWRHGSRLRPLRPRAEHAALPLTPSVATTVRAQSVQGALARPPGIRPIPR